MIYINYKLEDIGWATGTIGNGEKGVSFPISYLNDSLKELAESAIDIVSSEQKSVLFMGEPVDWKLTINNIDNKEITYELKKFDDGVSKDNYTTVLAGNTGIVDYVTQIKNILSAILHEFGIEKYKEKWIQDEFPLAEYEKLKDVAEKNKD